MSSGDAPEIPIEKLAQPCIDGVRELLDFELDFTVETLPVLDHYCRHLRTSPEWADQAEELACVLGVYFGEVLRRRFPSRWFLSDEGFYAWRLEFEEIFLCFNPLGVALEMLLEGEALGWNASYMTWNKASDALAARLQKLPKVSEGDFYTFSVRYEVLETVLDFLEGWSAKDEPRTFDLKFYQEQVAARGEPEVALNFG